MEHLNSVGNIILITDDPKANFQGLSMMLAIEACFNNYDPDFVYTGDSHPSLNWLPSNPLDEKDLLVKIDYCSENNLKLVIKDIASSDAPKFAASFDYPSLDLESIVWPLFIEGYNRQLDRRHTKQTIVKADNSKFIAKINELTEELEATK